MENNDYKQEPYSYEEEIEKANEEINYSDLDELLPFDNESENE